ncbi:tubulin polymerization-promoting protein family member 3-like [Corythoichthys intestinalis]|uniref:tubulin polymerization-promoting protein family member 3-like n=1 Tax=Corythoichthys intestinalis TaxID=161448 RepID=UPI0025A4DA98|nr:tubulin polymerization-promoting protein family member 3-like [Corythoichthys intestinalis]XP_057704877.1 tubulin polymerization-promoting protein family member 3-like [Corythoichthys intestinalis]XP_061794569.1 tubulin polymerization-promoting protein family member 3-like [Nerophis lumbriciformis]
MAESTSKDSLLKAFSRFAVYGDTMASGKEMNGKNWAKLCKDCKIIDGKNVSGTDVDIVFSKVKQRTARVITFDEFLQALHELAPKRFKGKSREDAIAAIYKLTEAGEPSKSGVTKSVRSGAVDRLTDTSLYTGSHKERFDVSGRGRGREGREDIVNNTGYVAAYKNEGTFDDKTSGK